MQRMLIAALVPLACLAGCARPQRAQRQPYVTRAEDPRRDTDTARRLNARAVESIGRDDHDQAETALKDALGADLFFGPAHNNLGLVYYETERYYLAAWEFQYAARLMPDSPEPRNNLGLVYEAVARLDEARNWYNEALELAPASTEVAGNLARARLRQGVKDRRTAELLETVVMKDPRPEWTRWARKQLALIGESAPPTRAPADEAPEAETQDGEGD